MKEKKLICGCCYICSASSATRRVKTTRHTLLSNSFQHPPKQLNPIPLHQFHHLLHPFIFHHHQLHQPPLPRATSRLRHFPMAPQIHPLHCPIPPHQKPRRNFSTNPRHHRNRSLLPFTHQRNTARRTQRQPRPRRAKKKRETQREVHHFKIIGPFCYQNGQSFYIRRHNRVLETASKKNSRSRNA